MTRPGLWTRGALVACRLRRDARYGVVRHPGGGVVAVDIRAPSGLAAHFRQTRHAKAWLLARAARLPGTFARETMADITRRRRDTFWEPPFRERPTWRVHACDAPIRPLPRGWRQVTEGAPQADSPRCWTYERNRRTA